MATKCLDACHARTKVTAVWSLRGVQARRVQRWSEVSQGCSRHDQFTWFDVAGCGENLNPQRSLSDFYRNFIYLNEPKYSLWTSKYSDIYIKLHIITYYINTQTLHVWYICLHPWNHPNGFICNMPYMECLGYIRIYSVTEDCGTGLWCKKAVPQNWGNDSE